MPFPENRRNINGFDKRPGQAGRKKKIYTILKKKGFCADDIRTAMGEMAFYNIDELKELYQDTDKPIIARIVANQYHKALKNADMTKIKEILEHFIGRPTQNINAYSVTELSEKEKEKLDKERDKFQEFISNYKSDYTK